MMVIAPFTWFESFTCAVTFFYFCSFRNEVFCANLPVKEYGIEGNVEEVECWKLRIRSSP